MNMKIKVYQTNYNLNDDQFAYLIKADEPNKYLCVGTKNVVYDSTYTTGNVIEDISRDEIIPTDLKIESFDIYNTFLFKYFINKKSNRNVRNILPQMIRVSKNSILTNEVAVELSKQLDLTTFKDFLLWLKIVENRLLASERNFKKFF